MAVCLFCGGELRDEDATRRIEICRVCAPPPYECPSCHNVQSEWPDYCPECSTMLPAFARLSSAREGSAKLSASSQGDSSAATVEFEYAGFWRRLAALLLDIVIFIGFVFVVTVMFGLLAAAAGGPDASRDVRDAAVTLVLAVAILSSTAYVWLANSTGGTLGKRALGIRVVSADDVTAEIGVGQGFVRYVVQVIGTFPLYLGWFWCGWDDDEQAWHDKAARSLVIKKLTTADEDRAERHVLRGVLLGDEERWQRAIAEFDKAIKLNPNHVEARIRRGYAYAESGEAASAIFDLEWAKLNTSDDDTVVELEDTLAELREARRARLRQKAQPRE